ncbi:GIY-YIG nuclease family protein [Algoriphagus halophytocola]|uniref:GIY-YIG nuclease family protein n=1 Tax=Algoriphagus halophytocola TaxID=2991499 RepID=UPI0037BEBE87
MATLYILFSNRLNKYYVGACTDLERRLREHNIGHSKFTATGIPWRVVYTETFDDLKSAKRRESYIKRMKSRQYIESLISSAQ